ncbi:MAG TPA: hypothetical protein VFF90_07320, partial [Saprospiraceae bacterium]|nr:hypothetical protein [Saprospiraceae bacterium]
MVSRFAPYVLIITLMTWMLDLVSAQNLVPNPSFEEVTNCPSAFGGYGPMTAPPWVNGFGTSCDVFNTCATYPEVDVPGNYFGWQQPHTGEGYVGAILKSGGVIWHEYPQAPLVSPMVADQLYYIGMYVSNANYTCAVKNIGMLISQGPPSWTLPDGIIANPQVYWENGYLTDTLNWTVIEGYYVAQGGENTVTIGNFYSDASTTFGPGCPPFPSVMAYYYIDDVWITPAVPCDILDVDLGDDVEACFEYTIDPDLGDLHYVWSTGSTDPTLTVNESGIYGLTITDSCRVGSDQIQVTILGNIPVDLGPDSVMICAGETYEIELNDDYGEYTWQDGSDDAEYSIESTGVYIVNYDDGCAQSSDTIVADFLDPPSPFTLGADTIICNDDDLVLSLEESLGDFEWDDGSTESSYTIDEDGTYALTISNMCGEESAEIEVVYDESPAVELGPDEAFICIGEILTFDFDEEEGIYSWQDSTTGYTYDISSPGLYSVTVTNTCGSDYDEVLVALTPPPQVNLGPDIVTCSAQLPDTLDVSGVGGTSVQWMNGSTLPQFIVTTPGSYSVTVSNVCGNGADTIQVTVSNVLPNVLLPADMIACEGDSVWLYSTGDQGAYLWQDGTNNDSLLVHTSGQYILAVSTICGIGQDTVNIQVNPDSLYPNLGPDIALCPGNSTTLYAGNNYDAYLWQDMSTADSLNVSSAGIYIVTVSNACGTGTDTVLVSANGAPPQLSLQDSMNLCSGLKLTLDAGIGGVNYLWNDGTQLSTLIVNTPGTYSLTVSNNCGMDMDTVEIVNGGTLPLTALGNDIQLCPGETQIIAPDFAAADNWMWQDGSTGPTYPVNNAGTVTIAATNACGTSYDTLLVTTLPGIPPLNLGNDTSLCESELLLLEINIPDVSITWFDGSQNSAITINGSGIYTAEIANACGVSTDTLIVVALPDVPQLMLGPDQFLCPGEMINFNPGIPNVQYLWQDGTTASSLTTSQTGLIILTISNICGNSTDSVLIVESTNGPQLNLGPDITGCTGDTITI